MIVHFAAKCDNKWLTDKVVVASKAASEFSASAYVHLKKRGFNDITSVTLLEVESGETIDV